jgi:hypothetical protein
LPNDNNTDDDSDIKPEVETSVMPDPDDPLNSAGSWAREGITEALEKGIVPDELQENYKNTITRIEFCRIAVKYIEYATGYSIETVMLERNVSPDPNVFTDTDDPDVLAAYALGVTSGTGSNTFAPNAEITREQAATMLMNVCLVLGFDVDTVEASNEAPTNTLTDMDSASYWAIDGINFCVTNGIMVGTGGNRFNPKVSFSREQCIITFNNIRLPE